MYGSSTIRFSSELLLLVSTASPSFEWEAYPDLFGDIVLAPSVSISIFPP